MNIIALLLASWTQAQTLQSALPNPAAATPIPGTRLPGVVIPRLPIPIETPTWPTQPIRLPSVLPMVDNVPVRLPGSAVPVYPAGVPRPVGQAVRVYPAAAAVPVKKAVLQAREGLGMEKEEKPSPIMLQAVFDGTERPAQKGGVVDTRDDAEPTEDLPWVTPSRQPTLPEWDLEREIGLRP